MDDYISREAAIAAVHEHFDGILVYDESGETAANEVEDILLGLTPFIPIISRADVRPVARGHWVRKEHPSPIVEAFCSNCGDPALRAYGHPARTNYCPNCGADMRPEPPEREVEA